MDNLYLPKDTLATEIKHEGIDNLALRINKYPKQYKGKFAVYQKYRENSKDLISKVDLGYNQSYKKMLLDFSLKYLHSLKQISGLKFETICFEPDWRLIVGLGSPSVYETSITLHHIYGIPYIPGQALKGVIRNYVICEYFENDEKTAENEPEFNKIFGSQNQQGKVTFFDALPITEPKLDFDIMNVHYKDYYSGKKEPTDDQNPNPITFLTVIDTLFAFSLGYENKQSEIPQIKGKSIVELMQLALEEKGVGAKSSVGYGYLKKGAVPKEVEEYEIRIARHREESEKKKKLDSLSEVEKRILHLSNEKNDEVAKNESMEIFSKIETFSDEEQVKIAQVLKELWQRFNIWQNQKKKQKDRVRKIKDILEQM